MEGIAEVLMFPKSVMCYFWPQEGNASTTISATKPLLTNNLSSVWYVNVHFQHKQSNMDVLKVHIC